MTPYVKESLLAMTLALTMHLNATEYFVGTQGSDTNSGLARAQAFATAQRGVDALAPGDTLTILPGEYLGSVRRDGLGSMEAETRIRAETPGTVILRGDVPAPAWQPIEGYRFVYASDFDATATIPVVNEQDTLTILQRMPNAAELEFTPGAFFHDTAAGTLYISTSDMAPVSVHRYTVSIVPTHGVYLSNARRVVIEGLDVTGFNALRLATYHDGASGSVWGLFLFNGKQCVVRDCRAWLNGWGIGLSSQSSTSGDNVIEQCTVWGNDCQFESGDCGGITLFSARRDMIRNCTSIRNGGYGINIYGTGTEGGTYGDADVSGNDEANRSRLVNNLAWGNLCDFKIKTGVTYFHTIERCIGPGLWSVTPGNVTRSLVGRSRHEFTSDNIVLSQETDLDLHAEFVDPDHHDYRLKATSRFRGTGPDGSDRGPYAFEPERMRPQRGAPGRMHVGASPRGASVPLASSEAASGTLVPPGSAPPHALRLIEGPRVHSLGATTANIEWTATLPTECRLAWGEAPQATNTIALDAMYFGTYSLTGLKPGRTYVFAIRSLRVPDQLHEFLGEHELAPTDAVVTFTTPEQSPAPTTYYVATDGDDRNTGADRTNAWRTIQHAANAVSAGDTVLIAGGRYTERVRIRTTGEAGAPITFRALSGEKVIMHGGAQALCHAFVVAGKRHLRFDGLYFRDYNMFPLQVWHLMESGEFALYRCRDVEITRCFSDGRGGYSARPIKAREVDGLRISNCVNINKMSGPMVFDRCPNVRLEHTVFVEPMIGSFVLNNTADQKVVMAGNIFTDMLQKKAALNALFAELEDVAALRLDNNCFLLRCFPPDERLIFADVDHALHAVTRAYTLPAFDREVSQTRTLFADPMFAGDPGMRGNPHDTSGFAPDRMTDPALDLDFDSFFATNPEVVRRGIGLQPEAFSDFHFNRPDHSKPGTQP